MPTPWPPCRRRAPCGAPASPPPTPCWPILTKTTDAKARKRAKPPRASDYTRAFRKDWQRLTHSGRYDMRRLKEAMLLLIAADAPLGPEWLDHALKGEWSDHRECHIGGDFLLIYRLSEADSHIVFVRAGTHAELFQC
ncbi:MAG: type II toxin-antitoxin system YafQ family toxin [Ottowia sp.]|nr:type II toxin-antitoxin system YafQ family toxin [Ottowia sp.]MBP7532377.1 type II toxin-antitoxin system YafQ family toxin [Ottowia sp.]MBP7537661.1 type II toxin-antitoxin system YafQ family toxin [Ottowia sp.]MBP9955290.1 type II toxin-antitoxin system YafQ family toxin [Ottowia sp.]